MLYVTIITMIYWLLGVTKCCHYSGGILSDWIYGNILQNVSWNISLPIWIANDARTNSTAAVRVPWWHRWAPGVHDDNLPNSQKMITRGNAVATSCQSLCLEKLSRIAGEAIRSKLMLTQDRTVTYVFKYMLLNPKHVIQWFYIVTTYPTKQVDLRGFQYPVAMLVKSR